MRGERIITALTIGVLVGLLIVATGAARRAEREATWTTEQVRVDREIIGALTEARDVLRAQLAAKPAERIVTVQAPCRSDVGHDTPVFARESQTMAGR